MQHQVDNPSSLILATLLGRSKYCNSQQLVPSLCKASDNNSTPQISQKSILLFTQELGWNFTKVFFSEGKFS